MKRGDMQPGMAVYYAQPYNVKRVTDDPDESEWIVPDPQVKYALRGPSWRLSYGPSDRGTLVRIIRTTTDGKPGATLDASRRREKFVPLGNILGPYAETAEIRRNMIDKRRERIEKDQAEQDRIADEAKLVIGRLADLRRATGIDMDPRSAVYGVGMRARVSVDASGLLDLLTRLTDSGWMS